MAAGSKRAPLIGGALVVLLAAFAAVYLIFFRGDAEAPLELSEGTSGAIGDPVGTWSVVQGPDTVAGYRVREKLARLPAQSDAVGNTGDVTGSMRVERTADGYAIHDVAVEADLTTVRSDSDRRDERMRTMGLETDRFPTASFAAAGPVEVPASVVDGGEFAVDLAGDLTIHGTTKRVTIPLRGQVVGEQIEVVGSLTFPMAEFGITPPDIAGIVSVEDTGTMEFKLRLAKDGT